MSSKDSVQRRPTLSAMFLRPKKPAVPDVPVPGGVKHTKEFSLTPEVPVPKEAVARIQKSREFAASLTIKEEPPRQVSRRPSSMQNSVAMQRTASSDSSKSSASSVSTGRKLSMARIQSQSSRMSVVARPSQPEYKPPVPVAMAPRKPRPSSVVQTPAVPAPNLNRKHSVANRVSSLQVPPPGPKREKLMNIRTDVTQSTQATAAEAAPPKKPTTPQSIHSEATQKKPVASDTILKKSSTSEAVQRKPSLISSSVHSPLNTHASYTGESDTDLGSPRRKHSNATTPDITKQMLESVIAELNNTLAIQRSRLEFTTSELDARNLLISELQKAPGLPPNLALAPAQNTSDLLLELELLKTETAKSIGYKNETIDSLRRQLRLKDTSIGNMTSQLAKVKLELDTKLVESQRLREDMAMLHDRHIGEILGLRKEIISLEETRDMLCNAVDGRENN
ncbi:hypothetical protein BC830DRAFT_85216 [Chytriomyces sp. MP71]|nr:hypothetical protein BC830DRAFT_85216 [Chytriomyces sp. MP71]